MTNQLSAENLSVVIHNNVPVVTTDLLAQLYGTRSKNISDNYLNNASRFICGKHYFKLTNSELKEFKNRPDLNGLVGSRARALILWTERGAARHAKMLETDQAWEVFEKLEDCYFSQREKAIEETPRRMRQSTAKQLIPLRQTAERLIATGMGNIYPDIWKLVHQRFDVEHIHQLPPDQISEAIEYLDALEGEYIKRTTEPVRCSYQFTDKELCNLAWLWDIANRMQHISHSVYPAMHEIRSYYAPYFYDFGNEFRWLLEEARKSIASSVNHIPYEPQKDDSWSRVLPRLRGNTLPSGYR